MRIAGYIATVFLLLLVSCGGGSDNSAGSSSGMAITLNFPDGFSVDRSTGELTGPSCENCNAAPSYVTAVTLTLSDGRNADKVYNVPLDTGVVGDVVNPGDYSVHVSVGTNINLTFTGVTQAKLLQGMTTTITLDLAVNAPPELNCTASNSTPNVGETVTISCTATDLDGDPLTFRMRDGKGWSASGAKNNYLVN